MKNRPFDGSRSSTHDKADFQVSPFRLGGASEIIRLGISEAFVRAAPATFGVDACSRWTIVLVIQDTVLRHVVDPIGSKHACR